MAYDAPSDGEQDIDKLEQKALVRKQDLRIVPLSAGIYLLCYLDRSNIGNAKVLNASTHNDLLSETHMTAYQYTIALMVFLIAYALFEVPSNYFLKKLRPSRWIAFLMISWGAITMGLGGTKDYASVTVVRFLLGVFEAGMLRSYPWAPQENHKANHKIPNKVSFPGLFTISHFGTLPRRGPFELLRYWPPPL